MKKYLLGLIVAMLLGLSLTGCGDNVIPELTDEEMKAVGEYVAFTLMKYDANHRSRLVELREEPVTSQEEESQVDETEESAEESQGGMDPVEETPVSEEAGPDVIYVTMDEALGMPQEISVEYSKEAFYDNYPQDDYFSIKATKGKQLLVMTFEVTNTGASEQYLDILSKNADCTAVLNGEIKVRTMQTFLPEDLLTASDTLQPGEMKEYVLVFEIDNSIGQINEIVLNLKNESIRHTIKLK